MLPMKSLRATTLQYRIPGALLVGTGGTEPGGQGWWGTEAIQAGEGDSGAVGARALECKFFC